jgi:hypothetical protein
MGKNAVGFGLAMIVLGVAVYVISGFASVTALIPSFFGIAIFFCGVAAARPARIKWASILAIALGLIGLAGSLGRIVPALARGEGIEWGLPTIGQVLFAVLALVFVVLEIVAFKRDRMDGVPRNPQSNADA